MRDTMHHIDSSVIISFLKAILRKFRECVENPLGLAGVAAKKLTSRLRMLLGRVKTASCHVLYGAHSCLVPVNAATTKVFKQLQDKKKASRNTCATDYRHLLLELFFIMSNLFREEADEHNRTHRGSPVVDPSEELIGVANVFLRWYKLFRQTTPGKTAGAISTLHALSLRYIAIICIIDAIYIIYYSAFIDINSVMKRLLDLFKTVSPYKNGSNRLIMDTEKVHGIKHCHVDVLNWANLINSSCDGPEAGHKTWIHQQGLKTNQGASSAKTLMTHSLNKEASQLLCDAMKCRVEDGDARAEDWRDSNCNILPADRFWNTSCDITYAAYNEGPCMGIKKINIWERAKLYTTIICIICIIITITITLIFGRFVVI